MMRSTITAILAGMVAFGIAPATDSYALAKVTKQEEGLFVTRDSATVATDPEETWLALVAPSRWWSNSHTWSGDADNMYLSPQGGGCFCELLPKPDGAAEGIQRGSVEHMVVVQADPGKVLRMRGGLGPLQSEPVQGVLTITLKPVDGGTRILWEYVVGGQTRFEAPQIAKAVDGVMSEQLARLVTLLGALEGNDESDDEEEAETDSNSEEGDKTATDSPDDDEEEDAGSNTETGGDRGADKDSDADADEDGEVDDGEAEETSTRRIEPKKVLSLEEAIDQMAGGDKDDR